MEMNYNWLNNSGLTDDAYKYNGKEMNGDFGLNWSDYGARWYDATVGRWWSVDLLAEKLSDYTPYNFVINNPIKMVDPFGLESEFYANGDMHLEGEDAKNFFKGLQARERKSFKNTVSQFLSASGNFSPRDFSLTVTDEVVGTGFVYAGGQIGTEHYFDVNIYRMVASYVADDGSTVSRDFEVLKYGVKYDSDNDNYYYQGFGNFAVLETDLTMDELTFDGHYTYGGFNLYRGGLYDLHPQHTAIRDIPTSEGGRANYGCIGVCGAGTTGWGGLTDMLFEAAGMQEQVGLRQRDKVQFLRQILTRIHVIVTVQPFAIPTNTPVPIKK
jgi:RHS repeat-associated protein